jgi:hypothetical protein
VSGIVDFRTQLLDEEGAPIDAANPLPVTGGGGGGSQVEIVDANGNPITSDNPLPVNDEEIVFQLIRILNALSSPQGYDRSLQRQRITAVIESGTVTTVSTVTTVGTVTNLSTIDTLQGRLLVSGQNLSAWSACVRARIT